MYRAKVVSLDLCREGVGAAEVASAIREGALIVYPAETMYGLGGDGLDPAVWRKIRAVKGRGADKPFLLLLDEPERWRLVASRFPAAARRLADRYWPGPLTLVLPAISGSPAAGPRGGVAVRVPDRDWLRGWVRLADRPLISTSANRDGGEPEGDPDRLTILFGEEADLIVAGPRFDPVGPPSALVDATFDPPRLLRAGPFPIEGFEEGVEGGSP
ncbi:MAG: L-threonylcarbamoyladenylate synthase [Candidatus Eisenbacteria bacterium]|nr:L-threonylcarbamoyladenylate synthase [Candidatus Eisenbacteria bacterium]